MTATLGPSGTAGAAYLKHFFGHKPTTLASLAGGPEVGRGVGDVSVFFVLCVRLVIWLGVVGVATGVNGGRAIAAGYRT